MKHVIFLSYIISFISGLIAILSMLLIYFKTKSINLKYYIYFHTSFLFVAIATSLFAYITVGVSRMNMENPVIINIYTSINMLSISAIVYILYKLITSVFKVTKTSIQKVFFYTLSIFPMVFYLSIIIFSKLDLYNYLLFKIMYLFYSFVLFIFMFFFSVNIKKYLSSVEEDSRKIVKIGILYGLIFCSFVLIVEVLDIFRLSPDIIDHTYFSIFFLIQSSICIYFSIRYFKNKLSLVDSDEISDAFLKKYLITPRESEIIELIIKGQSNKEISEKLSLTEGTVKVFIYNIYQKIGVKNRMSLANLARTNEIKTSS